MDCCSSLTVYDLNPKLEVWRRQFESLMLTHKEVGKLYQVFRGIDVDDSGMIDVKELMDGTNNAFNDRVFSIFDEDGSGQIDFREFVIALWNYLTIGDATLYLFTFDLYDKDCSGSLSHGEIEMMLKEIYGPHFHSNKNAGSVIPYLQNHSKRPGVVDLDDFEFFAKSHASLFFPSFELQKKLQKKFLGTAFWRSVSERRIKLAKGVYVPIKEFKTIYANEGLFNSVINASDGGNSMLKTLTVLESTGTLQYRREEHAQLEAIHKKEVEEEQRREAAEHDNHGKGHQDHDHTTANDHHKNHSHNSHGKGHQDHDHHTKGHHHEHHSHDSHSNIHHDEHHHSKSYHHHDKEIEGSLVSDIDHFESHEKKNHETTHKKGTHEHQHSHGSRAVHVDG